MSGLPRLNNTKDIALRLLFKAVPFGAPLLLSRFLTRIQYKTIGFAGEPVPPTIRSGAQMKAPS